MAEPHSRRRWLTLLVFALALYVIVWAASTPQATPPSGTGTGTGTAAPTQGPGSPRATATTPSAGGGSPSVVANASGYDPAGYASQVRTRARQAGVSSQLLMAILYNESYKPHDPGLERAWQRYKPDAAFGIANMHRATFDATRQGRDFADRRWEDLPGDRDLAIEAAAWYLHDLSVQLPTHWPAPFTRNELLALGYNSGAGNMRAFARGRSLGDQVASYLSRLHANWSEAGKAVGV
ncbi:transglycosylase SLT domain-containing protein [Streptomyces sp. TS71-3]|uniref:transglycosylase SLT domain-containing protein n=1 Tax=Streptomyces sp. TS71-3 TaxID=2733862 RepID=UPI001B0A24ED|nr:transglycosylase SLT domain-containing protein [Streptomyces sp. TS71-3]GHJ41311.1 hypothetical protein Sm713_69200 [Streptomyces sp. TS71-3]